MSPPAAPAAAADAPPARPLWRGGWRQGLSYGGMGLPLAFVALPLYVVLPNHYARHLRRAPGHAGHAAVGGPAAGRRGRPLDRPCSRPLVRHRAAPRGHGRGAGRGRAGDGLSGPVLPARNRSLGPAVVVRRRAGGHLPRLQRAVGDPPGLGGPPGGRRGTARAHRELARGAGSHRGARGQRAALGGRPGSLHCRVRRAAGAGAGGGAVGAEAGGRRGAPARHAEPAARGLALAQPRLSAACWRCSCSTGLPARCLPRWCCSSSATACRPRPSSRCSWPATLPPARCPCRCGCAWCSASGWRAPGWLGMVLAVAAFAWAALLGAGDVAAFTAVCIASGVALGADLALPGAMLAGVIQRAGHAGASGRRATSAGGTSPPSSTWRWPRASRCRCWRPSATAGQARRAGAAGPDHRLLPAALRPQARGRRSAAPALDPRRTPMTTRRLWAAAAAAALTLAATGPLTGCASAPVPGDYAAEKPVLDLKTYFNGELTAHGMFTDRSRQGGAPLHRGHDGHAGKAPRGRWTNTSPTATARRSAASGA